MGGRLDATSLCSGSISIITSISHDHTSHLGEMIEEIAFEKASIIKEGGTVFAVNQNKKVIAVIKRVAEQKSADLHLLGDQFWVERTGHTSSSQSITYNNKRSCFKDLELSLIGDFQAENAALALSACLQHAWQNKKGA